MFLMLTLRGGYFTTYLAHLVPPLPPNVFRRGGEGVTTQFRQKKQVLLVKNTIFDLLAPFDPF